MGFKKMKQFKNIREKVGEMRPWKKGWNPGEEDQLRKDKKLKKDLETYAKKKNQIKKIKDAEKLIPYLLNHINTNFGNGKGGDLSDEKFHQLSNAIKFYYEYDYLFAGTQYNSANEETSLEEATDLYNKDGIQITRFSKGKGQVGLQIDVLHAKDRGTIQIDGDKAGALLKGLQVAIKRGVRG